MNKQASNENCEFQLTVVKRDGSLVPFQRERIEVAIELAFRDTNKVATGKPLSADLFSAVSKVSQAVIDTALQLAAAGKSLTVEGLQNLAEETLMRFGHYPVARDYIIYRDTHRAWREESPHNLKIERRDKTLVRFNPMKIASSLERFLREDSSNGLSEEMVALSNQITREVVAHGVARAKLGEILKVEDIEEQIEKQLMAGHFYSLAKAYILRRSQKPQEETPTPIPTKGIANSLQETLSFACRGLDLSVDELLEEALNNCYEDMPKEELDQACLFAARSKVERHPLYAKVAARLLCDLLYREVLGVSADTPNLAEVQSNYFFDYLKRGTKGSCLSSEMGKVFDLERLAKALKLERDDQFEYIGIQTLYDRYLLAEGKKRIETPQILWMRVAMGIALAEKTDQTKWAIEFYEILSTFRYMSATPTIFNAGTLHPQLSSCYLSTIEDNLEHIFKSIADDALLSKWAGGLGNDWSSVRATGAPIKGTRGTSQGIVPFLKVANDTAVAVNQGGKRKGAMCAYLESWHLDIEEFLELRKNTGDERRRTHDMNTANWIPDLFMKRVQSNQPWTLFSPDQVPDLHHLYGKEFERRYLECEKTAEDGGLLHKKIDALVLWRKMLSMLFETGHPWITFKDPSNIRSPQSHVGIIHSSNLCTEILLNTSAEETAVCNLGSLNLAAHTNEQGLEKDKLKETIQVAMRMLDDVIDVNFYPTKEAKQSNLCHRAVGLGLMGFQDALAMQGFSYASHEAVSFADRSMEFISYHAILASTELAKERGTYQSYKGSKWDLGLLPIDTLSLLAKERGAEFCDLNDTTTLDWSEVRRAIAEHGMRNCNTLAIAPTATIANIVGVSQSIEPTYKQLYAKSNLSGEFTIYNPYLVKALQEESLWDDQMIDDLKYFDGSIREIDRIPKELKRRFVTAFEIDPAWIIECASRRQKWIDMGQSLNLYLAEPSGKKLHQMYMLAWKKGLKTTYYLRTLGATQIEKSTTDINKRGFQPRWMENVSPSSKIVRESYTLEQCESCQ